MPGCVTVAVPTLDAGPGFAEVLDALLAQRLDASVELLVCDSGSSDGTPALARDRGASVIEIERAAFSHGGTRNLLMARSAGEHVAFLTQDAVPADAAWLGRLLTGFTAARHVGLAFGPYRPRPGASLSVRRELEAWFGSLREPDGSGRVDGPDPALRGLPARRFLGPRGYFTDANGCVSRAAWEEVPFRAVGYAEDHWLAQDMLRAGWAKAFVPDAVVVHSHDYSPREWLGRAFDETRGVRAVYGWTPAGDPRVAVRNLRGTVGADWRAGGRSPAVVPASLVHHGARSFGALLGAHADALPRGVSRRLSLEGRVG